MTSITGIATSFIDFTRASNATVTDSDGKIKWAPHNLLTNSESFDAASWTRSGLSGVTANSVVAPNGTTTADLLVENSLNDVHRLTQSYTPVANSVITIGAFVKQHTAGRNLQMVVVSGADVAGDIVSSADGTSLSSSTTGTAFTNKSNLSTIPVSNGFYYVSFSVTVTVGTAITVLFGITSGTTVVYTGNGTAGLYLWGAHLYRSDLGGMQANTSAYPMYNPTTPKNLLGYTEDFSNAAWAVAAGTATKSSNTEIAPNGLQTADTLTATSANTIIWQTYVPVADCKYTASIWLKRKSGTGTVQFTEDGANFTTVTLTSSWQRFSATYTAPAGSKAVGIKIVSSGDEVYAWGAQLSDSASLDTYSPVYGAAVTSAAYYGPRRDFDPVSLACKGLLVEEQRSNLLLRSEEFDNASWTKASATATANSVSSPTGVSSADTITAAAATASHYISQNITWTAAVHTVSVYVKQGTQQFVQLTTWDGTTTRYANFDIQNGTAGSTSNASSSITSVGNGWYRITLTTSTAQAAAAGNVSIGFINSSTAVSLPSYATAGTETFYLFGAQSEAGSFATSYIPTGAATATRNADLASVSTQAFPYSATEGTLVASGSFNTGVDVAAYLVQLSGAAAGTSYGSSNAIFRGNASSVGTGQRLKGITFDDANNLTGECVTTGDVNTSPSKVAYGFAANNFGASINGSAVIADTSGSMPTAATVLTLGAVRLGGNYLNGHIRQITYLPRRISNAELVTRST